MSIPGEERCKWWVVRQRGEEEDHLFYYLKDERLDFTGNNFVERKLSFGTVACTGEVALFNDFFEHNRESGWVFEIYFNKEDPRGIDEKRVMIDEVRLCSVCKRFDIIKELGE